MFVGKFVFGCVIESVYVLADKNWENRFVSEDLYALTVCLCMIHVENKNLSICSVLLMKCDHIVLNALAVCFCIRLAHFW